MNELGLLLDGQPVALVGFQKGEYLVSDGEKDWWVPKELVKRI